ncbi:hypothetical protein VBM90_00080 [Mycoplasma sp. 2704]|uniref:hypothetical protein n=1 Tax=unclassified Mycoplasma TaxID=2683645 RepID=UPI002B1E2B93|nr:MULTISPECIES: hypothetical protein [unclassified Mycoplasma]MEA4134205.1 hypothetical protein [Mycoplasma sp. 2704]MEA4333569.1 hypothetical protein [Mycoplasma sp. 1232]
MKNKEKLIDLFEVHEISDDLFDFLFKKSKMTDKLIMPILQVGDEYLFCEVKHKKFRLDSDMGVLLYTADGLTDYELNVNTIFKIKEDILFKNSYNINHEVLHKKISEFNELEILQIIHDKVMDNLRNVKVIQINRLNNQI